MNLRHQAVFRLQAHLTNSTSINSPTLFSACVLQTNNKLPFLARGKIDGSQSSTYRKQQDNITTTFSAETKAIKALHDIISPDLPTSNLTSSDDRRPDSPPTSETVPYCTVTLQCGILTHPLGLTPFSHRCIFFPPSHQSLPSHPSPIKLPSPPTPLPPTNHHPPSASSSSPPHRQKARFFRHALTGYSADGRRKEKRAAWPVHSPASASAPALAIRPLQNPPPCELVRSDWARAQMGRKSKAKRGGRWRVPVSEWEEGAYQMLICAIAACIVI